MWGSRGKGECGRRAPQHRATNKSNYFLYFRTEDGYLVPMQSNDLQIALVKLDLEKAELAALLGVTLRTVHMWIAGDREVPGPAVAYLRLLQSLSRELQAKEIALSKGQMIMDGMYRVDYAGSTSRGSAALVFQKDGTIFGHDGQVSYDGTFSPSLIEPGKMDLNLQLTVPSGVALAQGVAPQPAEYQFAIRVQIPPRSKSPINVPTPYGPIISQLCFLRPLPN